MTCRAAGRGQAKESAEDIMQWLQTRVRDKGIEQWLEHRIQADLRYEHRKRSGSGS
jgi:hypothetical protein